MCEIEFTRQLKQLAGMPAAEFVLHREPMLLLDRLVDVGPGFADCDCRISESNAFAVPGSGIPAYVGIETMAQCIAVYGGARARVRGFSPPLGFLLGTRHYQANIEYFAIGATYHVECRELIRDSEGLGSYHCRIMSHGNDLAEARLTIFEKQRGEKVND